MPMPRSLQYPPVNGVTQHDENDDGRSYEQNPPEPGRAAVVTFLVRAHADIVEDASCTVMGAGCGVSIPGRYSAVVNCRFMASSNSTPASRARFGLYEVDLTAGELQKSGMRLRLQEQPFQVLAVLLENAGRPVLREELRQRLWPADTFVDFDHSLNTAINKLRDVLGDTASNPRFIETLPRRGYRFIAPVEWIPETPAQVPVPERTNAEGESKAPVELPSLPVHPELPHANRRVTRLLFGLLQVMYLIFYACALWRLDEIAGIVEQMGMSSGRIEGLVLVSGVIGVVLRLYTVSATSFNYAGLGWKFRRLMPLVFLLDLIWALAPFLLVRYIGFGLSFASCAALLYSPFAQRVLAEVTWPAPPKSL